ncbi:MAG: uncharacterized protein A8A55_0759 [Amphiamblys sp. WSBS2006]|nr:MAG: uncharacterized protein A8A55_0759 [Amphiamblys sp. WSBS2006]
MQWIVPVDAKTGCSGKTQAQTASELATPREQTPQTLSPVADKKRIPIKPGKNKRVSLRLSSKRAANTPDTHARRKFQKKGLDALVERTLGLYPQATAKDVSIDLLDEIRITRRHTEEDLFAFLETKEASGGGDRNSPVQLEQMLERQPKQKTRKIKHTGTTEEKRKAALGFILETLLCYYRFPLETAFIAVRLFDTLPPAKSLVSQRSVLVYAAACCFVAGKLVEEDPEPCPLKIAGLVHQILRESTRIVPPPEKIKNEILQKELFVLEKTKWDIFKDTPRAATQNLVRALPFNVTPRMEAFLLLYTEIYTALTLFSAKSYLLESITPLEHASVVLVLALSRNVFRTPLWGRYVRRIARLSEARMRETEAVVRACLASFELEHSFLCSVIERNGFYKVT